MKISPYGCFHRQGQIVGSKSKGDKLEVEFYQYLLDEQRRGELVFGTHAPDHCKIFNKKKYYCKEREDYVEFDVVIEVYRAGRPSPQSYVVFECKNFDGSIPEIYVREFSSKLSSVFQHAVKGVVVVSSRLQSGAEKVAKNKGMGIVKYDDHGLDIIADRAGRICIENTYVESQIFRDKNSAKSLKFSAFNDGRFFGTVSAFLESLDYDPNLINEVRANIGIPLPYIPVQTIKKISKEILNKINYVTGSVNLEKICSTLSIDLNFNEKTVLDADGRNVLGSANFTRNSIQINPHSDKNRERFTVAHEIGHFQLQHGKYLRSENIIERDLLINEEKENSFNYDRLEFQANAFASNLLLPDDLFRQITAEYRHAIGITNRGHGYIFVDDQPYNYQTYRQLCLGLSSYFEVSVLAIEIKFKSFGMLTDQRKKKEASPIWQILRPPSSIW